MAHLFPAVIRRSSVWLTGTTTVASTIVASTMIRVQRFHRRPTSLHFSLQLFLNSAPESTKIHMSYLGTVLSSLVASLIRNALVIGTATNVATIVVLRLGRVHLLTLITLLLPRSLRLLALLSIKIRTRRTAMERLFHVAILVTSASGTGTAMAEAIIDVLPIVLHQQEQVPPRMMSLLIPQPTANSLLAPVSAKMHTHFSGTAHSFLVATQQNSVTRTGTGTRTVTFDASL